MEATVQLPKMLSVEPHRYRPTMAKATRDGALTHVTFRCDHCEQQETWAYSRILDETPADEFDFWFKIEKAYGHQAV